ncbi:metallophosphoesterase [Thalassoporum mexicanum PCC 7367]|uniref:metallophosphoesterase n=1 Tax=Thalassoporum mexicanum TaxID=3457544 RepID=UPI00029FE9A8|nr:metallophosphoesterase [Pseudanabaena sp. PCC 7367]AFY68474.1 metallophosphoesterase [Pseudanabaena sp. PCC 7367]
MLPRSADLIYNLMMLVANWVLLYLGSRLARWRTSRLWLLGFAIFGSTLLAGLGAIAAKLIALRLDQHLFGMARLFSYALFIHGVIFFAAIAVIAMWGGRRSRTRRHRFDGSRKLAIASFLIALTLALVGAYAFLIEPYWLAVSRHQIVSSKITAPIRVLVIADLQTDVWSNYERKALLTAQAQNADLILWAGDYIQADSTEFLALSTKINNFLQAIELNAPLGNYAVQGNIDYDNWPQIFFDLPIQTITTTQTIELPGLCLTGLAWRDSFSTKQQVAGCGDRFHIVLGHAPDYALGEIDADLMLAGHTHGGQVRLPFFGALMTASKIPRAWVAGLTNLPDDRALLVSRGVGMERGYAPRVRFLCRPELVVIDLLPAA